MKMDTLIQESHAYLPAIDLPMTDLVLIYGIGQDTEARAQSWRERGFEVGVMVGLAWGEFPDFLQQPWNGTKETTYGDYHSQRDCGGRVIFHGNRADMPYLVPSERFANYLAVRLQPLVAAGILHYVFEEPEFWHDAGPSPALPIGLNGPTMGAQESAGAWRLALAKQQAYTSLFETVSRQIKACGHEMGRSVSCYVATHSLINYAQWRIVSPESRIFRSSWCDGAIGQVWTGTARTPAVWHGIRTSRPFLTAFLEFAYFAEWVRAWQKPVWALADPVEDNPEYTWPEYRTRYMEIVVAALMHDSLTRFELCPWPFRAFTQPYQAERMPADYQVVLRVIFSALTAIGRAGPAWSAGAAEGRIGILVDDNTLFHRPRYESAMKYDGTRFDGEYSPAEQAVVSWDEFFGLALPLLQRGYRVYPVPWSGVVDSPRLLDAYCLLILSYQLVKPESPRADDVLVAWLERGGQLVIHAQGTDLFEFIPAWWNQGGRTTATAWDHLRRRLDRAGHLGSWVGEEHVTAAELARDPVAAEAWADRVMGRLPRCWRAPPGFSVRRGPYHAGWGAVNLGLKESGKYVDLSRADLPVVSAPPAGPAHPYLLYRLDEGIREGTVIAATVPDPAEPGSGGGWRLRFNRPRDEPVAGRIRLTARPLVHWSGVPATSARQEEWDDASQTFYWRFDSPGGPVSIDLGQPVEGQGRID